jgi:phage baseplate assembly protein W
MPGNVRIVNKLYPSDYYKESAALAIKLPMNNPKFRNSSQIFNQSFTTEEQVISNYINLLLTRPGERFMQPNFGVGLMSYVFEPNAATIKVVLRSKIEEQTAIWLPYINLVELKIDTYDNKFGDENTANIQIIFNVFNSNANRVISVFADEANTVNIEVE